MRGKGSVTSVPPRHGSPQPPAGCVCIPPSALAAPGAEEAWKRAAPLARLGGRGQKRPCSPPAGTKAPL